MKHFIDMSKAMPVFDLHRYTGRVDTSVVVGAHHFVDPDFPMHRHTHGELVAVLSGSGVHTTGEASYPLRQGDVFYIPPMHPHGFRSAIGMDIQNIAFDESLLTGPGLSSLRSMPGYHALFHLEPAFRSTQGVTNRLRLSDGGLETIRPMLDRLGREYRLRLPGYPAMLRALVEEIITWLSRVFSRAESEVDDSIRRVARVASTIECEFASSISLEDLAGEAGVSRNHLIRLFTKTYGVTPMRRLSEVRLEHARRLLAESERPVAEVGRACGISDPSYFSRLFRQVHGLTPAEYRSCTLRQAQAETLAQVDKSR